MNIIMLAHSTMGVRHVMRISTLCAHLVKNARIPMCETLVRQSSTFHYVPDVAPAALGNHIFNDYILIESNVGCYCIYFRRSADSLNATTNSMM